LLPLLAEHKKAGCRVFAFSADFSLFCIQLLAPVAKLIRFRNADLVAGIGGQGGNAVIAAKQIARIKPDCVDFAVAMRRHFIAQFCMVGADQG